MNKNIRTECYNQNIAYRFYKNKSMNNKIRFTIEFTYNIKDDLHVTINGKI